MKYKGNARLKKVISNNCTFIPAKFKTYCPFIMNCNLPLHTEIKATACFPVTTNVCRQYQHKQQGADDGSNK
jgi:hypothetical protein